MLDSLSRMEIFFIMGRRLTIIVERLIFKRIFPQRVYEWRREIPSVFVENDRAEINRVGRLSRG